MSNDMTTREDQLPDYLREFAKERIGNIDSSDLVIPRVKLMQALSPELIKFNNAKVGTFWQTIASENMGEELLAIPIVIKKIYVLWAPRGDDRMILARASDGKHWDVPDLEFTVKRDGSPTPITYRLGKTVKENGMDDFGSSIPGDPRSIPAASLTYNMLWYFPEFPELSPSVIINTRSGVAPMRQLLSKIEAKSVAHYAQMFTIGAVQQQGPKGTFYNYSYTGAGFADKETCSITKALYDKYKEVEWKASEESADTPDSDSFRAGRQPTEADNQKY